MLIGLRSAIYPVTDLAAAKAAQALDEVQDVGGGIKVGAVRDPFGNRLGFIENPHAAAMHPMDAMVEAAAHHEVLLESDKIRVLDTRVTPGDRTPVHAHQWPAALYVLSWSDFVRRDPQGNVIVDSRLVAEKPPEGAALWIAPLGPHSVENVGDSDLHIIAVEVKSKLE